MRVDIIGTNIVDNVLVVCFCVYNNGNNESNTMDRLYIFEEKHFHLTYIKKKIKDYIKHHDHYRGVPRIFKV